MDVLDRQRRRRDWSARGLVADVHHATTLAAEHERNADRLLDAQRDHPLRDDHARRHSGDRRDAAGDGRSARVWRSAVHPEVSDGYILVGVEKPAAEAREGLRATLEAAGGRVKTT